LNAPFGWIAIPIYRGGAANAQHVGRLGNVVGRPFAGLGSGASRSARCASPGRASACCAGVVRAPVLRTARYASLLRLPVVRTAHCAECDCVRRVVQFTAGCAGCGSVRNVVEMAGSSCRCGPVQVWSAHASRKRLRAASRPTRVCSRPAGSGLFWLLKAAKVPF
jgi:hypothetical protein